MGQVVFDSSGVEAREVGGVDGLRDEALPGDGEGSDVRCQGVQAGCEERAEEVHEGDREEMWSAVQGLLGGTVPVRADEGDVGQVGEREVGEDLA